MNILEMAREKKILLVAHRGVCGGNIPCNSLQSFQAALNMGADMIIANSDDIRIIHRIMDGRKIGTLFKAQKTNNFDMIEYVKNLHH